jgi:GntR family transcriptional regulator, transcriptional repressor for pyruvate dehydrogenase complex
MTEPQAANAAEQISSTLRREIIGQLHEGDRIGLAEDLAKRFGVSSATVRQALRVLEADGLVTVRRGNNGGYFASTPSVRVVSRSASALLQRQGTQLADLLICAQLLGPEVAALAAASPDTASREALVAYVEQAWSGRVDTDVDVALEVSVELSRRTGELCGSPPLALFAAVLADLVMDIQRHVRPITPPELVDKLTNRVHESQVLLARAIADGNIPAARQAQHLNNSALSV